MQRIGNPFPIWLDVSGTLIDAGRIFIGEAGEDPEVAPIDVFWDADLSIPAAQPLRTRGGIIVNNGSPAFAYVAEEDYSQRVRDADGQLVSFVPSVVEAGTAYQPLNANLTALAAVAATVYGRSLLTVGDAAALRALAGIAASLPLAGGTMTGNIVRQGAGPHLFHNDPAMTSGKVFVTAIGDPDPTSAPGDIWLKY